MWPTIDRARRRLSGGSTASADSGPTSLQPGFRIVSPNPDLVVPNAGAAEDFVVVLVGADVDRIREALQHRLGNTIERPDTPDRIARALSVILARNGADGRPRVLRRPAGLSTPKSWEIHLEGVDGPTVADLRAAARTGRFAR